MTRFRDRTEAGQYLAGNLAAYANRPDVLILALPRGGVPVAAEVAEQLHAPLDVFLVRKLGFPGHEEFAVGAIASGGVRVLNEAALRIGKVSDEELDRITEQEMDELERREKLYRGNAAPPGISGKVVLLVDDGLATGSTMRAAVAALRQLSPARIVVAVPVGAAEACELLSREADEVVCAMVPFRFKAVGEWYEEFGQTTDAEVQHSLERARRLHDFASNAS